MSEINWNELKDKAHSNAVKHGFGKADQAISTFFAWLFQSLWKL